MCALNRPPPAPQVLSSGGVRAAAGAGVYWCFYTGGDYEALAVRFRAAAAATAALYQLVLRGHRLLVLCRLLWLR